MGLVPISGEPEELEEMDVDGRVKARDDLLNASADAAAEARPFTLALCPWGRMALERRRATATEEKQRCG